MSALVNHTKWIRPLLGSVSVLFICLLAIDLVVEHQAQVKRLETKQHAEQALETITVFTNDSLRAGNYEALESFLVPWANQRPEITTLQLVTKNGFCLIDYQRSAQAQNQQDYQQTIDYGYDGSATLMMSVDNDSISSYILSLRLQLIGISALFVIGTWLLIITWENRIRETTQLRNRAVELRREIAQRESIQRELFREKELAQVTLESIHEGVITTDAKGRIADMNLVAEQLTGWQVEHAETKHIEEVLFLIAESTGNRLTGLGNKVSQTQNFTDCLLQGHDNNVTPVECSVSPLKFQDKITQGLVYVVRDVSQSRAMARKLTHQATHDFLTELINRQEFERRLGESLQRSRSDSLEHALLYLDLDQFKIVNDTCGHTAGDELLRQLSRLLKEQLRKADTLARLGGDEFGILLENCPLERAMEIAKNIRQCLRDFQFLWEHQGFNVGVSIGLTTIKNTSPSVTELLINADSACYAAKEAGRGQIRVFGENDRDLAERQSEMLWVSRLQEALREERFQLWVQTISPLQTIDMQPHHEILIRMTDTDGKIIPPGNFLPAAERYGLINAIDRWVIRTTLKWIVDNPEALEKSDAFSINVSGQSLGDNEFAIWVVNELRESGVAPKRICFEVTETAAITQLHNAMEFFATLRELGCRFALDDFGTGLSSFAYLKNLPVNYLKIDGAFIRDIETDPIDRAMVCSIHEVAQVMGLQTIAEFVENDAIRATLKDIGVDYAQGYGINMPHPIDELVAHAPSKKTLKTDIIPA